MRMAYYYRYFLVLAVAFWALNVSAQMPGRDLFLYVTGKTFADYVEAQKACCAYYGIPVLDQFNLQGINEFNMGNHYKDDLLHMNEEGYRRIAPVQADFLSNGR